MYLSHPRNKDANIQEDIKPLILHKIRCSFSGIIVCRHEPLTVSDRDAADSQTPSCIKNPEQDVMVGRGTVLLTFFVLVIIIKQYLAVNSKDNMDLWTSYEMVGSVD